MIYEKLFITFVTAGTTLLLIDQLAVLFAELTKLAIKYFKLKRQLEKAQAPRVVDYADVHNKLVDRQSIAEKDISGLKTWCRTFDTGQDAFSRVMSAHEQVITKHGLEIAGLKSKKRKR